MQPLTKKQIQKRINKGKQFSQQNLKYAPLREFDLSNANLFRADLEGADLEAAIMVRIQALGANFEGANLLDALLCEAYLEECNFFRADLEECDLRKADLRLANLRETNATGASFERADLEGIQAGGAQFNRALFRGADLQNANLVGVRARDAVFAKANMRGAFLQHGDFRGANFTDADLSGADLEKADLRGACLQNVKLDNAILDGCRIAGCLLPTGSFPGVSARWLELSPQDTDSFRIELDAETLPAMLNNRPSISLVTTGSMNVAVINGITRFFQMMETILPQFHVEIIKVTADVKRISLFLKAPGVPFPSLLSFYFFLLYQFENAEHIDFSALEQKIIEAQSPILSSVLLKKRPLTTEIVKKILKVKKVLKVDNPYFQGAIVDTSLWDEKGSRLYLARVQSTSQPTLTWEKQGLI